MSTGIFDGKGLSKNFGTVTSRLLYFHINININSYAVLKSNIDCKDSNIFEYCQRFLEF